MISRAGPLQLQIWWRIDSDHFQYGGILRKVERVELGEKVGADEEEK